MSRRIFILLVLIFILVAAAVVLGVLAFSGSGPLAGLVGGGNTAATPVVVDGGAQTGGEEPGEPPPPTATPEPVLRQVVISQVDIPIGAAITEEILEIESRPVTNIALQGGYTFDSPEDLIGRIAKVDIKAGQAILQPMLALSPSDIANFGSDLALYIERGRVAVAFPIDRYSGAAYAMRSGDLVDVLMSFSFVDLDEEFNTVLPNIQSRVFESELLAGRTFLFEASTQGRLELIEELDLVGEITPSELNNGLADGANVVAQIPRRATQLTIQQAAVLWVGTWRDPQDELAAQADAQATASALSESGVPTPTPLPERFEQRPDLIILSMSTQDALALKWSLEVGADIDLVLRSQGDRSVFATTSVSLPQIIEQGGLVIPENGEQGLSPALTEVLVPAVPPNPPDN